jgi:hypothetical protein
MEKKNEDMNKTMNTIPDGASLEDLKENGQKKKKKEKDKTIRRTIVIIAVLLLILLLLLFVRSCNGRKGKNDPKDTGIPAPTFTPALTPVLTPTYTPAATPTPEPADLKPGDSFLFGVYEQDNDLSNGKEPIEWKVLSNEAGELFIVSKYALEVKSYNDEYVKATWESCTLRKWLNEDFLKEAFSEDERSHIKPMALTNGKNRKNGLDGGNDTIDRVFLLSYDDVVNPAYGFSDDFRDYDIKRRCTLSVYARGKCEYSIEGNDLNEDGLPGCIWWIRMPGIINTETGGVNGNGQVSLLGFPDNAHMGIRPAICLQPEPVSDTSPAPTDTPSPTFTPVPTDTPAPTFTPAPTYTPVPTDTPEPTLIPTSTATPVPTATWTPKPTRTPTPTADPMIAKLAKLKTGDTFTFGSYEQDNDLTNGAEPIEWIVLSNKNNELYVMSKYALDAKQYHEVKDKITWADCTLRKWLNEDFLNAAFNKEEIRLIKTKRLKNEDNPRFGTEGGVDTTDRLFLLSYKDLGNTAYGFSSDRVEVDLKRRCTATAYAVAQGVRLYTLYQTAEGEDVCFWWTRMACSGGASADAEWDGTDYRCTGMLTGSTYIGVRPAMYIDLKK